MCVSGVCWSWASWGGCCTVQSRCSEVIVCSVLYLVTGVIMDDKEPFSLSEFRMTVRILCHSILCDITVLTLTNLEMDYKVRRETSVRQAACHKWPRHLCQDS